MRNRIKDCGRIIDGIVEHPVIHAFGMAIRDDDHPDYLFVGEGERHAVSWPLPDDWPGRLVVRGRE